MALLHRYHRRPSAVPVSRRPAQDRSLLRISRPAIPKLLLGVAPPREIPATPPALSIPPRFLLVLFAGRHHAPVPDPDRVLRDCPRGALSVPFRKPCELQKIHFGYSRLAQRTSKPPAGAE